MRVYDFNVQAHVGGTIRVEAESIEAARAEVERTYKGEKDWPFISYTHGVLSFERVSIELDDVDEYYAEVDGPYAYAADGYYRLAEEIEADGLGYYGEDGNQ